MMRNYLRFLMVIFLVTLLPLYGKENVFININEENGLSQRWVRCIHQDNFGFMWFGTKDGLNRYDGYVFKIYRPENTNNGLSSGTINNFFEEEGNFWICTSNGVSKYHNETDKFESFAPLEGFEVNCMLKSSSGSYWFGTQTGLFLYNPTDEIIHQFMYKADDTSSLSHNQVECLLEDSKQNLWIGTLSGLNLFNSADSSFIHVRDNGNKFPYSNVFVRTILEDSFGRIWLGIYDGGVDIISKNIQNPESFDIHRVFKQSPNRIFISSDNKLWVSWVRKNGIQSFNLDRFDNSNHTFKSSVTEEKWLQEYAIEFFFEDRWNDLWIGTYDRGVFYLSQRHKSFNKISKIAGPKNILSSDIVNVFYEDDTDLWIGTEFGLDRYNRKTGFVRHYNHDPADPNSIGANSIYAITKDSRGNLWVGTWNGGLNLYNPGSDNFTRFLSDLNKPGSILSNNVFSIVEDNKGNLWIGNIRGGLCMYDRSSKRFVDFTDRLISSGTPPNTSVNQIYQTSDGNLWVSNYSALNLYNYSDSSFTFFVHNPEDTNSIAGGDLEVIFEDSKQHLWLGTERGLNYFDREKNQFKHYTAYDGLPSSFIMGILEDDRGNLWISTNNGISKFVQGTLLPKNPTFINFNQSDGLPSNEFVKRSTFKSCQGTLYFGGINGFVYFYPDSITLNPIAPPVIITDLYILNQKVVPGKADSILPKAIYMVDKITLSYKIQFFSIHYTALNYLNTSKNSFAYMLEGFDEDWIYVGSQRQATYTNLDPGRYIFRVKAANNDGVWNEVGASLEIRIKPPFWRTLVARITLVLLIIAGIYAIFQLRINRITHQKKLLENMVMERTQELTEVNTMLEETKEEVSLQNEELVKHRYELEKLVQERTEKLRDALGKAEESDRLKSSFLANMSHEIRTPMNAIVGFASLLDSEDLDEESKKKYLQIINSNSETLLVLINDILEVSMIEANQIKIDNKSFSIDSILTELEESYQLKNSRSIKIEFVNKKERNSTLIYNDPVRFNQCISNLINNALKYTRQGHIRFGYTIENNEVIIYVSDSGIGIDKKETEHIFQFFYKVEDTETHYRGTGLGLAITSRLTELMGGKIWVESEPGKGSTFYISLPYHPDCNENQTQENKPAKTSPNYEKLLVLVAEDDPINYELIQEILKPTKARVIVMENGIEAIEVLKNYIDRKNLILLLDIKMPKMDGYAVMKEIIKMKLKIPVIAVTAYASQKDKDKILREGFTDYLAKPVRSEELLAIIGKVLKKKAKF